MGQNKILILPVIAALVSVIAFLPQDAHAIGVNYIATTSGNWNDGSTWAGGIAPIIINSGDTVTIPGTITVTIPSSVIILNHGTTTNTGTIIISGTLFNEKTGTLTNSLGANINVLGMLGNHGTLTNLGTITNSALLENDPGGNLNDAGTITNNSGGTLRNDGCSSLCTASGTINIKTGGTINNNSGGTIHNYAGTIAAAVINVAGTINNSGMLDNEGKIFIQCGGKVNGPVFENPPIDSCPNQIPDFPFSYSLVIMFVAVSAVYLTIRQKMATPFYH